MSATIVTEKTTPNTVITPAARALSSCRAPSALSMRTHDGTTVPCRYTRESAS